ncbi:hypothetical protein JQS43_03455 [Natronosporangium hydrolyticum]|uniref:Uncharacterized protein n=1 Tax=Natronosporangium hydrolyticum TaxID=2811111 RepID=A0A895YIS1_9ACTN|nr:hypothetical protein [Natronosporangium hydrolyticum]QSB15429.1 hypothetical protein JQS43_03455 [Natronosporangium hydrolyticum]
MEDVVSAAADRLYAVPPRRFVAERTAAAATARASGDRAAASAITKLRRPTVAAWLVNLLALRRPELVDGLVELAESLRGAQRRLDGAALRELAGQRRAAVSALVSEARTLAVAADRESAAGALPLGEVETTLHAALAEPAVAEQVRSGRLLKGVAPTGFGAAAPRLRLVTGAGAEEPPSDEPRSDEPPSGGSAAESSTVRRERAEAALGAARAAASQAEAALAARLAEQQAAQTAVAELDAALAELTARRQRAAEQLTDAEAAVFVARREEADARQRVAAAAAELTGPD